MNTAKFYQLLNEAEVTYDGDLASIEINKNGVLIDVYMWNEDEELQVEEINVALTEKQKKAIELKFEKARQLYHEENEVDTKEHGFSFDDYQHFESLIYA